MALDKLVNELQEFFEFAELDKFCNELVHYQINFEQAFDWLYTTVKHNYKNDNMTPDINYYIKVYLTEVLDDGEEN